MRFNEDGSTYLTLTGNLPDFTGGNFTGCFWVRRISSAPDPQTTYFGANDGGGGGAGWRFLFSGGGGSELTMWTVINYDYNPVQQIVTDSTWRFVAMVVSGNSLISTYYMADGDAALTTGATAALGSPGWTHTLNNIPIANAGNPGGDQNNAQFDMCQIRLWTAALSPTEILAEAKSASAVRTSNLEMNIRGLVDYSDTVHASGDYTIVGSLLASASPQEPSFPTNPPLLWMVR